MIHFCFQFTKNARDKRFRILNLFRNKKWPPVGAAIFIICAKYEQFICFVVGIRIGLRLLSQHTS